jgi:hypothetical protein
VVRKIISTPEIQSKLKEKSNVSLKFTFKINQNIYNYPATYDVQDHGKMIWFIDQNAGSLLLKK